MRPPPANFFKTGRTKAFGLKIGLRNPVKEAITKPVGNVSRDSAKTRNVKPRAQEQKGRVSDKKERLERVGQIEDAIDRREAFRRKRSFASREK